MDCLLLWACFVLGYFFLCSWYQFVSVHLACTLGLDLSLEASLSTQRKRIRDFKRESNVESCSYPTRCISSSHCTETIFDSYSQPHIPFNHLQILFISFSTRISSQNIPTWFTLSFFSQPKEIPSHGGSAMSQSFIQLWRQLWKWQGNISATLAYQGG